MKITQEMIDPTPRDPVLALLLMRYKAHEQEEWCRIYTGRSWHEDLSHEWAKHIAVMCDAQVIDFNDPLLAPIGGCDHPYDISKPCALRKWEHAKVSDEQVMRWWAGS